MSSPSPEAVESLVRPAKTAGYAPAVYGGSYLASAIDGRPRFSWLEAERMRLDPQVQFGLRILRAPLWGVTWKVAADRTAVGAWVDRELTRVYRRLLPRLLRMYEYGVAAGEVTFRAKRSAGKTRVHFDEFGEFHPRDARPLVYESGRRAGKLAGLKVSAAPGGVLYLDRRHGFWLRGEYEYGSWFGRPRLAGAYPPWLEKRGRNGATDIRSLFYKKNSLKGPAMRYPPGRTDIGTPDSPLLMSNQDIAREIAEKFEAGGVLALPNTRTPDGGDFAWTWEDPKTFSDVAGLLDYPKQLDREILIGLGIPPELVEAATVGSGYSGRAVPAQVFFSSMDEVASLLIEEIDRQIIRPLVRLNFGAVGYEVTPDSLAQLVAKTGPGMPPPGQGDDSGGGGGGPGPVPYQGPHGGTGYKNPVTGKVSYGKPKAPVRLSLTARRAAKARRRARREAEADRARDRLRLSWSPYQGSHGGHGWINDATKEVRYQAARPTDAGAEPHEDTRARKLIRALRGLPRRAVRKAREKVAGVYQKLEQRYGPGYAKAIWRTLQVGLGTPIPGALVAGAGAGAVVLAAAELHLRLKRLGAAEPEKPDVEGIVKPASRWALAQLFGRVRGALRMSWTQYSGPRGGAGWVSDTGEVRYQKDMPEDDGGRGPESVFDHPDYAHLKGPAKDPGYAATRERYHKAAGAAGVDPAELHKRAAAVLHARLDNAVRAGNLKPGQTPDHGRLVAEAYRGAHDSLQSEKNVREGTAEFADSYFDKDSEADRAKHYLDALADDHNFDPAHLDADTREKVAEDLSALPPGELIEHLVDTSNDDHGDAAFAIARRAASLLPAAKPVRFDGLKHGDYVVASRDNLTDGQQAAFDAAARLSPAVKARFVRGAVIAPADGPLAKALEDMGGDPARLDDSDEAFETLFNSVEGNPVVSQKDAPKSAKNYGTTSGALAPEKVDDAGWDPSAVDTYKRLDDDWYLVRRGTANPKAGEGGFEVVARRDVPPLARLPDPYWANYDPTTPQADDDAVERTEKREEKATAVGAEDKKHIREYARGRQYTRAAQKVIGEHKRTENLVRSDDALRDRARDFADNYDFADGGGAVREDDGPTRERLDALEDALAELREVDHGHDFDPDEVGEFDSSLLADEHDSRADHAETARNTADEFDDWHSDALRTVAKARDAAIDEAKRFRKDVGTKLRKLRAAAQAVVGLPTNAVEDEARDSAREIAGGSLKLLARARRAVRMSLTAGGTADPAKLRRGLVMAMLHFQELAHAKNDPEAAAPYLDALAKLARDPAALSRLRLSWAAQQTKKGGTKAVGAGPDEGRVLYGKKALAALRAQDARGGRSGSEHRGHVQRSGEAARAVLSRLHTGEVTPEQLEELATHLPALTVDHLRRARVLLGATWGGGRVKKGGMVDRLMTHVRGLVDGMRQPDTQETPENADDSFDFGANTEPAAKESEKEPAAEPKKEKKPARRKSPFRGESLAAVVKRFGGIDPNDHALKTVVSGSREAMERGVSLGVFKKGGRGLDQLAQELHTAGHIQGVHPQEYLMDKLAENVHSLHADQAKYHDEVENDYWRKRHEAEDAGADREAVERASRVGEGEGAGEGRTGALGGTEEAVPAAGGEAAAAEPAGVTPADGPAPTAKPGRLPAGVRLGPDGHPRHAPLSNDGATEWLKGRSAREVAAVKKYTSAEAYEPLNKSLRDTGHPPKKLAAMHAELQKVFAAAPPLKEPVTCFRAMALGDAAREKFLADARRAMETGGEIVHNGYVSTSAEDRDGRWNAGSAAPAAPAEEGGLGNVGNKVYLKIAARRGIDVSSVSGKPKENEVLLNHGSKFRVKSIKLVQEGTLASHHVELEQVDDGPEARPESGTRTEAGQVHGHGEPVPAGESPAPAGPAAEGVATPAAYTPPADPGAVASELVSTYRKLPKRAPDDGGPPIPRREKVGELIDRAAKISKPLAQGISSFLHGGERYSYRMFHVARELLERHEREAAKAPPPAAGTAAPGEVASAPVTPPPPPPDYSKFDALLRTANDRAQAEQIARATGVPVRPAPPPERDAPDAAALPGRIKAALSDPSQWDAIAADAAHHTVKGSDVEKVIGELFGADAAKQARRMTKAKMIDWLRQQKPPGNSLPNGKTGVDAPLPTGNNVPVEPPKSGGDSKGGGKVDATKLDRKEAAELERLVAGAGSIPESVAGHPDTVGFTADLLDRLEAGDATAEDLRAVHGWMARHADVYGAGRSSHRADADRLAALIAKMGG